MDPFEEVRVGFNDATVTWSASVDSSSESSSSEATQLGNSDVFTIRDINLQFPNNELSLICGATGSGKSLILLSLLGETVVTKGTVSCPRAPIVEDVSADFGTPKEILEENWILDHALAYVSQTGKPERELGGGNAGAGWLIHIYSLVAERLYSRQYHLRIALC